MVKWDRNGVETKERPNRVRVYDLKEPAELSVHDGRLAVRHLKNLVRGETCSFWQSRGLRPDNETCREYCTWNQGRPSSGCFHCEAVEFLKRIDPKFNPYRP